MSKISNATAAEAKTAQHVAEQNVKSTPNAGTTGEHASPDETLQKGHAHKKQTDFVAREVVGAHRRAAEQQIYGKPALEGAGNPKHRLESVEGTQTEDTQDTAKAPKR
jgi:hypothetical protein